MTLENPMIDEQMWERIPIPLKKQLIEKLDDTLFIEFCKAASLQFKEQLVDLHVDMPDADFKQRYAQLQFMFAFWNNFPTWIKLKKDELIALSQSRDG